MMSHYFGLNFFIFSFSGRISTSTTVKHENKFHILHNGCFESDPATTNAGMNFYKLLVSIQVLDV